MACACRRPYVGGEGGCFEGQELLRAAAAAVVVGEVAGKKSPGQNT